MFVAEIILFSAKKRIVDKLACYKTKHMLIECKLFYLRLLRFRISVNCKSFRVFTGSCKMGITTLNGWQ